MPHGSLTWNLRRPSISVGSALVGITLLAAFIVVELRTDSPLVPLRLLRVRALRTGLIIAAAWMSSFGMQLYFLTIYLQEVLNERPLRAGLSFLPLAISIVIGTQVGGRLVGRLGFARSQARRRGETHCDLPLSHERNPDNV